MKPRRHRNDPSPATLNKSMSIKYYLIDTNVLLHDPTSIFAFADNKVIITQYVLEELDHHKTGNADINFNAREVVRKIRQLNNNAKKGQTLATGLPTPGGGTIQVVMDDETRPVRGARNDDKILQLGLRFHKESKLRNPLIVVTKDGLMEFKAQGLGLKAEDYEHERVQLADRCIPTIQPSTEDLNKIHDATKGYNQNHPVTLPGFLENYTYKLNGELQHLKPGYVILQLGTLPNDNRKQLAFIDETDALELIVEKPKLCEHLKRTNPIRPKNLEQKAAVHALLDTRKKLVCMLGRAGTGKTLLAIAAALELAHKSTTNGLSNPVIKDDEEDGHDLQIIISRPMVAVGKEMGFLPGSAEDKLHPWMTPIFDNLEVILGPQEARNQINNGRLKLAPIPLIRGRSLNNCILIIDEAQNLTPHEAKTIITRAGKNCRVVLCGDPSQIDHNYMDATNNGLSYTAARMDAFPFVAVVTLIDGVRSRLSEAATDAL